VSDIAVVLQTISGPDILDPCTLQQPSIVPDYISALSLDFPKKKRVGVLRGCLTECCTWKMEDHKGTLVRLEAFEKALKILKDVGAELVDPVEIGTVGELLENRELVESVFRTELKVWLSFRRTSSVPLITTLEWP
jgi:amidase